MPIGEFVAVQDDLLAGFFPGLKVETGGTHFLFIGCPSAQMHRRAWLGGLRGLRRGWGGLAAGSRSGLRGEGNGGEEQYQERRAEEHFETSAESDGGAQEEYRFGRSEASADGETSHVQQTRSIRFWGVRSSAIGGLSRGPARR